MTRVEQLARELDMQPDSLISQSIEFFLKHKLKMIESELFLLSRKYGVKTVTGLDKLIKEGKFHEEDTFEDYFKFDNLEAERDIILKHLGRL